MTAAETGLTRVGGVVVLSGPALRSALQATLITIKNRNMSGLSTQPYEALACELNEAMAADGQSVVRPPAVSKAADVDEPPIVPIAEAAARLGISVRQARRLAPKLGGRKIAGSWFVDEPALRQHTEGKK